MSTQSGYIYQQPQEQPAYMQPGYQPAWRPEGQLQQFGYLKQYAFWDSTNQANRMGGASPLLMVLAGIAALTGAYFILK